VDDAHHGSYSREPQIEDLLRICRALNNSGARYVLIGGFAVIVHGGARTTKDIDLLVDSSPDNVVKIKQALRILADRAVDEVAETDVAAYTVVRVADEVVIDLMAKACEIDYNEAAKDVYHLTIDDVVIPVASPSTLVRTKRTMRPSDAADRHYLEELLRAERGKD
jgi:predicted nucleotidyltransferase